MERVRSSVMMFLLLAATSAAAQVPPDSVRAYNRRIQEQEDRLKKLRSEIQDIRTRDRELGKRETFTAKQLRKLEREAAVTADLLRALETKETRITSQLDGIRAEHAAATEELATRRRRLARTLRAMYVRGSPTTVEVLLRTTSLRHALSHFKYLEELAHNNERLVKEIHEQERYLARTDALLTETLVDVETTTQETRAERERLATAKKSRQTALARVRSQRTEYQQALRDLAASERKVSGLIATLEKRRQAAQQAEQTPQVFLDAGFAALRGRLPWPARGRVLQGFGRHKHPRYGTITENSGVDIGAPEGDPVRAVARGQVEVVDWFDGWGKTVLLNHGGYYTLYAHLSEAAIAEGQTVDPGQIIGRVGDTGSLDGAKLHFEIRAGADAVDPRLWLAR
jgi:septal ring factor EnvC (AmiA/AmiB activator)